MMAKCLWFFSSRRFLDLEVVFGEQANHRSSCLMCQKQVVFQCFLTVDWLNVWHHCLCLVINAEPVRQPVLSHDRFFCAQRLYLNLTRSEQRPCLELVSACQCGESARLAVMANKIAGWQRTNGPSVR